MTLLDPASLMSIRSRQYVASINPSYLASLIRNPALTD
jgi:hypothetical protein